MKTIAIIGAGPAGMSAAIAAARKGAKVTVFERNEIAGKKLLLTGNGKCNFTNVDMHADFFSFEEGSHAELVMETMSTKAVCDFFADMGVLSTERKGCFYALSLAGIVALAVGFGKNNGATWRKTDDKYLYW